MIMCREALEKGRIIIKRLRYGGPGKPATKGYLPGRNESVDQDKKLDYPGKKAN